MKDTTKRLVIAAIRIDGGTQPRAELDGERVQEYRDAMRAGAKFPPVVVFNDGRVHWLADGFHRVAAAQMLEQTHIAVEIRQGTQRDAILHSVGANATHGLPRTNADKRRAVERLLSDAEWREWADNHIARVCVVSNHFVAKVRKDMGILEYSKTDPDPAEPEKRKYERGGKTHEQATKKKRAASAEEEEDGTDRGHPFSATAAVAEAIHAVRSIVADWPHDVSLEPLIAQLRTYADSLERRSVAA